MLIKQYIDGINRLHNCEKEGRKIWIRGTKAGALLMYNELNNCGIHITGFVDVAIEKIGTKVLGLPVVLMDSLYKQDKTSYYIVCSQLDIHTYFAVRKELEENGLTEINDFYHFGNLGFSFQRQQENAITYAPWLVEDSSVENMKKRNFDVLKTYYETRCKPFLGDMRFDYSKEDVFFSRVNIVPNLSCTLRCKYCCAGCQYSSHKTFDYKQSVDDFDKLLNSSKVLCAGILGGELFLHKDITKLFRKFSQMKNIRNCESVEIFTNAMVIPSDEALEAFNEIKIPKFFMISNYDGLNSDNKKFVEKLKKYGIQYEIFPPSAYHVWNHPGDLADRGFEKINYTPEALKEIRFKCCDMFGGWTILEGKLYPCGYNVYALYPKLKDYFDIHNENEESLKQNLFDFMYTKESYDICEYCRGTYFGNEKIPIAEQL